MKKREIALSVILSIVTCGIYGIVWLVLLANDLRELANEQDKMSGGLVALLSVVTCGIYMLYWYYQAGKSIEKAKYMRNISTDDAMSLVYLLLGVFGLGIVSMCLIQNEVNNLIDIPVMNNGAGFGTQTNYGNSQPFDNQNYYNSNPNYNPNTYNNPSQNNYPNQNFNPNQDNFNNPNNTNN